MLSAKPHNSCAKSHQPRLMRLVLLCLAVAALPLFAAAPALAQSDEDHTQQQIDSLLNLLKPDSPDSLKAAYYNKISEITGSVDTVMKYSLLTLDYCQKTDTALIAISNRYIAWAYYMADETKTGLPYAMESARLYDLSGNASELSHSYRLLAKIYEDLNDSDSIKYYINKALSIDVQMKDTAGISQCYKFLGIMHCNKGFFNEAVQYYQKAVEVDSLSGNALEYAYAYYRIGEVYTLTSNKIEDSYKAKDYLTKSIRIQDSINSKKTYYITNKYLAYSSLADVYISLANNTHIDRYADSCYYFNKKTIDYFIKQGRTSNATVCGYTYVKYLKYYKRYRDALAFMKNLMANHFGEETNQYAYMEYYTYLKDIYLCLGDYKNAYECFEKASKFRNELVNDSVMFALADAKTEQAMMIERMDRENAEKLFNAEKRRMHVVIISLWSGLTLVLVVIVLIARVLVIKKRANNELLQKNAMLAEQKEQIRAQRDEIEVQRDRIKEQNSEIQASINYAQRIQHSLLTPLSTIDEIFPDHFLLYKPRSIVSGDFYWVGQFGDNKVCIVADCTGHGVPGGFMSVLGMSNLNHIVGQDVSPDAILNHLRETIIANLRQGNDPLIDQPFTEDANDILESFDHNHDGMDVAAYVVNERQMTLTFAGANNPLVLIRDNKVQILQPDRMPVGISRRLTPFKSVTMELRKGDCLYTYSDGYQDQFNHSSGAKFLKSRLCDLLLEIHQLPMAEQCKQLDTVFNDWRGPVENQTDDVVIMGVRI